LQTIIGQLCKLNVLANREAILGQKSGTKVSS
jgi:hypothetical protein